MLYQMAKHLSRGSRIKETTTGEIYIVERIDDKRQVVFIYGREEHTHNPKCFDHRKVEKVSMIEEMHQMIIDKSLYEWKRDFPVINAMLQYKEQLWINSERKLAVPEKINEASVEQIYGAALRMQRFAPYIRNAFPETSKTNGLIVSDLVEIPNMLKWIIENKSDKITGKLYLKCDNCLPVSGSIKARGGFHEVLFHAEQLALLKGLLKETDNYSILANETFHSFFSQYSIAVGSTGNLGLSIGIMAAKLGFQTVVHMSSDARKWKKDLLREKGVTVIEYEGDYGEAVKAGREKAKSEENCYFVDDESSRLLFFGYAAAAIELKEQLAKHQIQVDKKHPLFVYLPCGVGGGPGGVTFGLKEILGENVHCFFAEPTHAPCMMLGMTTEYYNQICVQDFGLDNHTEADGLAVGRASGFVGQMMETILDGCYTVKDDRLFEYLKHLSMLEQIHLEPSALAGMHGPFQLFETQIGRKFLEECDIENYEQITHIVWATGGGMVPLEVLREYGADV